MFPAKSVVTEFQKSYCCVSFENIQKFLEFVVSYTAQVQTECPNILVSFQCIR